MPVVTTIHLWESSNQYRKHWPITVSVPFARGLVNAQRQVIVRDPRAGEIPCQRKVLVTWPDKSIKWLLLDFPVDLAPREHVDLEVEVTKDPVGADVKDGIRIEWAGESLTIDTGALRCDLAADTGGLVRSLRAHGVDYISHSGTIQIRQPLGRILDVAESETNIEVEERGPQRSVVAISGQHGDANGSAVDYVLRLTLYAKQPVLHWTYTITNREDGDVPISSVQIAQPVDFNPKDSWAYVGTDSTKYTMPEGWVTVTTDGLETRATDGHRQSGNLNTIRAEVQMEPFLLVGDAKRMVLTLPKWAHFCYPKAVHYYGHALRYDIWPETAGTWSFRRGMAKSHDLIFRFSPPAESYDAAMPEVAPMLRPITPVVPPEYIESTEAIPAFFAAKPQKYPAFESRVTRLFRQRARSYGMLNFGDAPSPSYTAQGRGRKTRENEAIVWVNNEYDLPYMSMIQFLRSGDPLVWRNDVEPTIWHMMDVDTVHHDPDDEMRVGGQVYHSADHIGPPGGGVDPSHEWVEGLILYHLLTGLEYPKEHALALGEHLLRWTKENRERLYDDRTAARVSGWALIALTALYEFTHDKRYLDASVEHAKGIASRIEEGIGHLTESVSYGFPYRAGFMTDIAINGLKRLVDISGDERWKDLAIHMLRDQYEHLMAPEGFLWYKELPENHHLMMSLFALEPAAYVYQWTGDKQFLELGIRHMAIAGPTSYADLQPGLFLREVDGALVEEARWYRRDAHSMQWFRYMLPFCKLLDKLDLLKEFEGPHARISYEDI